MQCAVSGPRASWCFYEGGFQDMSLPQPSDPDGTIAAESAGPSPATPQFTISR